MCVYARVCVCLQVIADALDLDLDEVTQALEDDPAAHGAPVPSVARRSRRLCCQGLDASIYIAEANAPGQRRRGAHREL